MLFDCFLKIKGPQDLMDVSVTCRTVPKPVRKAKVMEVKGRRVFGVPLLLSVQQTGEPLPPSILRALVYLRTECLDQVMEPKTTRALQRF